MDTSTSPLTPREWTSHSPEETEAIARELAGMTPPGQVIQLNGELGAGKTCFARGFVSGFQGDPEWVNSPSFTLVQEYPAGKGMVYHWDLYRLSTSTDWSVLDLAEHLADTAATTLVEWPERYPGPWPENGRTWIVHLGIHPEDPNLRTLHLLPPTSTSHV
jgi:tRNA threonylcarbamoyladenosine biosynthesis protein TsaE